MENLLFQLVEDNRYDSSAFRTSGIIVTGTGFFGRERVIVRNLCSLAGIEYSGDLKPQYTTVVVCRDGTEALRTPSLKVQRAWAWGLPVVGLQWLLQSIAKGYPIPFDDGDDDETKIVCYHIDEMRGKVIKDKPVKVKDRSDTNLGVQTEREQRVEDKRRKPGSSRLQNASMGEKPMVENGNDHLTERKVFGNLLNVLKEIKEPVSGIKSIRNDKLERMQRNVNFDENTYVRDHHASNVLYTGGEKECISVQEQESVLDSGGLHKSTNGSDCAVGGCCSSCAETSSPSLKQESDNSSEIDDSHQEFHRKLSLCSTTLDKVYENLDIDRSAQEIYPENMTSSEQNLKHDACSPGGSMDPSFSSPKDIHHLNLNHFHEEISNYISRDIDGVLRLLDKTTISSLDIDPTQAPTNYCTGILDPSKQGESVNIADHKQDIVTPKTTKSYSQSETMTPHSLDTRSAAVMDNVEHQVDLEIDVGNAFTSTTGNCRKPDISQELRDIADILGDYGAFERGNSDADDCRSSHMSPNDKIFGNVLQEKMISPTIDSDSIGIREGCQETQDNATLIQVFNDLGTNTQMLPREEEQDCCFPGLTSEGLLQKFDEQGISFQDLGETPPEKLVIARTKTPEFPPPPIGNSEDFVIPLKMLQRAPPRSTVKMVYRLSDPKAVRYAEEVFFRNIKTRLSVKEKNKVLSFVQDPRINQIFRFDRRRELGNDCDFIANKTLKLMPRFAKILTIYRVPGEDWRAEVVPLYSIEDIEKLCDRGPRIIHKLETRELIIGTQRMHINLNSVQDIIIAKQVKAARSILKTTAEHDKQVHYFYRYRFDELTQEIAIL